MYGLKIAGGDIAVRGDGRVSEVEGSERLRQEISHWLLEPLGTDTLYRRFGSTLGEMVGSPMLPDYIAEVRAEVSRVVGNYLEYQKRMISEDKIKGDAVFLSNWKDDDIIDTIDGIDVRSVADTLYVTVKLTTVAGTRVTVVQTS